MTKRSRKDTMPSLAKGSLIPQTVENLHAIMEQDAVEMLRMRDEISQLRHKVNQLQQKLRSRYGTSLPD